MKKMDNTVASILAFSAPLAKQCSSYFRSRSKLALFALITIHLFTVSSMAYGWYHAMGITFAVIAAIFLFALLFNFDRATLSGPRHYTTTLARILITLTLPLLNAAFFDLAFFQTDIEQLHHKKTTQEQMSHAAPLLERAKSVEAKIDSLWAKDQAYAEAIGLWRERKVVETNGKGGSGEIGLGPVYEVTAAEAEAAIIMLQQQRQHTEQRRKNLEQEVRALNAKAETLQKSLIPFDQTGPAYRMELLSELLFHSSLLSIKIFSIAYLLLFFVIDMMPVLPMLYLHFEEYLSYAEQEVRQLKLIREFRDSQMYQLHAAEVQADIEQKLAQLHLEAQIEAAQHALSAIQEELKEAFEFIAWLEHRHNDNEQSPEHEFYAMKKAAITRALDRFEEEVDHIRASVS
ncbi:MAG: DUF4407 domain-containing protein [bacterium]|nr:DUF4407 domain-containing protein [bacterium]